MLSGGSGHHGSGDFLNVFEKVGGRGLQQRFVQLVVGGVGSGVFVAAGRRRRRRLAAQRFSIATAVVLLLVLAVQLVDLLLFLLLLHASVLEPDFDLPLGETEGVGNLDAAPTCQILVEAIFLLQLEGLMPSVRLTTTMTTEFSACIKGGGGNGDTW